MSAHTPGPWHVSPDSRGMMVGPKLVDVSGALVAAVSYDGAPSGDSYTANANAARIVAAVNYCEGMTAAQLTEDSAQIVREELTRVSAERDALRLEVERNGEAIKLVADQADAWRLERDALRAALARIIFEAGESGRNVYRDIARAALAQGGEK